MAEAAGLALGAIPLLISAVEHYEECFRILGCMQHFKQEYRKCKNRVKSIELEYDLMLDKLFLDVVDSQEELERLKSCPDDQSWIDVEARLSERLLPKLHRSYIDTMKDLRETIEDLGQELGVDKSMFQERMGVGKVPSTSDQAQGRVKSKSLVPGFSKGTKGRISYEAQRLKFSQGKNRREDLFGQIERYIRSLDSLMGKNDDVNKMLHSRQTVSKGLSGFWRHARNVYSLLSQALTCPCKAEHFADLLLTHRETTEVLFNICFRSGHCHGQPPQSPWVYHRTVVAEIRGPRQPQTLPDRSLVVRAPVAHVPGALSNIVKYEEHAVESERIPMRSALKSSSKKSGVAHAVTASALSVSFAVSSGSASLPGTSRRTTNATTPETVPTQNQALKIDDLCQAISRHIDTHPCSGLLAAPGINEEYFLTSQVTDSKLPGEIERTTLNTLLSDAATIPNRSQRYSIAFIIASSHLQLHSSSWLGRRWSGEDILFDVDKGAPTIAQPHLRSNFVQDSASQPASAIDESFVSLGILLLELCFGLTLERSPVRDRYRSPDGQPNFIMDQIAALEWAYRVEGEAGPEFADAVFWCLRTRGVRPNDDTWRHELSQKVLEPLESAYRSLTAKKY